ncbi:hypothetical protein L1987_60276 [Smallanthus sonchifolius]|uniref:Uncharacterized protein n=1 Tax=Smallanthus sonchifolius TaxID=185202 RepID=A0ACB9D7N6_9ASTR|nr:hypothetical protein L1987_60276 [Smallanthus sonchifolius]
MSPSNVSITIRGKIRTNGNLFDDESVGVGWLFLNCCGVRVWRVKEENRRMIRKGVYTTSYDAKPNINLEVEDDDISLTIEDYEVDNIPRTMSTKKTKAKRYSKAKCIEEVTEITKPLDNLRS